MPAKLLRGFRHIFLKLFRVQRQGFGFRNGLRLGRFGRSGFLILGAACRERKNHQSRHTKR